MADMAGLPYLPSH